MAFLSIIRRWALREHLSIREIARRTQLSRNTIRKYLRSGAVEPKFSVPDRPSKLDPYATKLAVWLKTEAGKSRKQRRTAKQLHEDLVKLGYTGSYGRFTSTILPPYLRRAKSIEELLPWLYLKGISTGDFSEALSALLGPDAPGLSATTITRLKADWWDDYERWSKRDLSTRRYVCFWADGVYVTPRMDEDRQCMRVIIGADEWGNKDGLGLIDGLRESTQSWRELLLDLKRRGLEAAPKLAVGDGAMGSGRPCTRFTARPGCSAAGFTRRRMCSTRCRNLCAQSQGAPERHLSSRACKHALPGNRWPRPRPMPMRPSISSSRLDAREIRPGGQMPDQGPGRSARLI